MKLTKEHLDCKVEGIEVEGDFRIAFNAEASEANRRHRINYTLKSDGITLRELLLQAGKPRVITKQNAMRRNCGTEEEFVAKCKEADHMSISLKPGTGGFGRTVSTDEAFQMVLERVKSGAYTEENCPESLKPYFPLLEKKALEQQAEEEAADDDLEGEEVE